MGQRGFQSCYNLRTPKAPEEAVFAAHVRHPRTRTHTYTHRDTTHSLAVIVATSTSRPGCAITDVETRNFYFFLEISAHSGTARYTLYTQPLSPKERQNTTTSSAVRMLWLPNMSLMRCFTWGLYSSWIKQWAPKSSLTVRTAAEIIFFLGSLSHTLVTHDSWVTKRRRLHTAGTQPWLTL